MLNGEFYVLGGLPFSAGNAVEVFNPETGAWRAVADLPVGSHHGSAAVVDGKLYSIGGFATFGGFFENPLDDVLEFDPETGEWSERAPLPSFRGSLISIALDGLIYAVGGRTASDSVGNVTIYDPQADEWSSAAAMPLGLDHMAAAAVDGEIYVAGGRVTRNRGFVRNDPSLFIYDPGEDEWREGTPLPTSRSGHAAASINGFLLVMGGEEIDGVFDENEVYNPSADRWFRLDDLPTARHGLGLGVIGNQVLAAAGGTVDGLAPSTAAEVFNVLSTGASLAQFAVGESITSQLVLSNPGEEPASFRAEFHRELNGQEFEVSLDGETNNTFSGMLAPGELRVFTSDEVEGDPLAGGVTLFSDSPLLSNVIFSGPQGFAGVAGRPPVTGFFVSVFRNVEEGVDSGLALSDASGQANRIELQLLDTVGAVVAEADVTLEAFGHVAQLLGELFEGQAPDTFNGSIRAQAQGEIGAVALLLRPSQFATLPIGDR